MLYFKSLIMEVARKKMKTNLMWMVVGVVIMGGVYFLSYYDVDEAMNGLLDQSDILLAVSFSDFIF